MKCARCGHIEFNHTRTTWLYRGINICLVRSGFLGWRRCDCIEFKRATVPTATLLGTEPQGHDT